MNSEDRIISETEAAMLMVRFSDFLSKEVEINNIHGSSMLFFLFSSMAFMVLESAPNVEEAKYFINASISSAFKGFSEMNKVD